MRKFGVVSCVYLEGAYRQLDPATERRVEALWDSRGRYGYCGGH